MVTNRKTAKAHNLIRLSRDIILYALGLLRSKACWNPPRDQGLCSQKPAGKFSY